MQDNPTKVIRCAIYTRKSSDEGLEQEFNSLDAQRESCEAYIKSQQHEGWVAIPTLYDDGGFSGGSMERPAIKQILEDVKAGLVNTIVVYKVDRLTRSLMDFAKIVDVLDKSGASFVSVTQQFNTTTSMGRLTLNVLLSFAQFEREVTAERIRDKVAQSKAKGMWTGGCVPLGYDTVDKKLIINSIEAETIRLIFNRYLELGCVQKLQADLDASGAQSKRRINKNGKIIGGGRFSRSALYQILKNHIYAGEIAHQGKVYPGQHEAILAKEVWVKTQELLAAGAVVKKHSDHTKSPALLAGLVYDDKGNRLTSTHSNKGKLRYRYYTSQAILQFKGEQTGEITRVPAQILESAVIDDVKNLLADDTALLDAIGTPSDTPELTKRYLERTKLKACILEAADPLDIKELLTNTISRVDVMTDKIALKITRRGLRNILVDEPCSHQSSAQKHPADLSDDLFREISVKIKKTGRGTKLILEPSIARPQANDALIKAVIRSKTWIKQLIDGEVASVQEIADKEKLPHRYTSRLLRLGFMAPNLIEAILEGRQSPELTIENLMDHMPLSWGAQEQRFGPPS